MSTNYIDQITDTAGTTHDISESDSTRIFRATCSTAASTAAKVATLDTSNRNFSLATGVRVAVTFTYGNSATTPTLRVDGSTTGTAKTIATPTASGTLSTGNGTTYNTWGPYETVIFTYNGTYWVKGASSLGAYTGQPISMATSTGTSSITLAHSTKYALNIGGNSYVFTTPSGGEMNETDPIYSASAAAGITSSDITNWNSKTSNTGTVTSVGITNGGGLSVSGSPVTTSGSITVGHSNSVTAQTTQAIYPIKIDAQGHISAYGTAVTPLTSSSTLNAANLSGAIPSAVTATTQATTDDSTKLATTAFVKAAMSGAGAGTVTSVTVQGSNGVTGSGTVTSSGTITLSHDDTSSQASSSNSGRTYIQSVTLDDFGHVTGLSTATESVTNTDTKLQIGAVTSGTTYYPIVGANSTTAATRQYDSTGISYTGTNGTAGGTNGNAVLALGNSTASSSSNWKKGTVRLYGTTAYYTDLVSGSPSANRTITFPNATGTVALTSDISYPVTSVNTKTGDVSLTASDVGALPSSTTIPSITLNGSATTSPSFYAPTGAGTSGQYLKSSGSGAPTWTNFPTIPSITLNGSSTTSPSFYAPTSGGTSGYVLQSNGTSEPTWTSATLTDTKLQVAAVTSGTTYYPIVGTGTTAATRQYDTTGLSYNGTSGTSSVVGTSQLALGNSTASGAAGNKRGLLAIYSEGSAHTNLRSNALSTHNVDLPDAGGTVRVVTASGMGTTWSYVIYENNTLDAWYHDTNGSVSTATTAGANWYRSNEYTLAIPNSYGSGTILYADVKVSAGLAALQTVVTDISTSNIKYYILYPSSLSSRSCTIHAYIHMIYES